MSDQTQVKKNDPEKEAWIANFFTENHLAYEAFPNEVASPEQLKFIVYTEDEPFYYPCSDRIFDAIINKENSEYLILQYMKVWEKIEPLVHNLIEDDFKKKFLHSLLEIKFRHETSSLVMMPSRVEKRLLQIFVRVSEIDRPLSYEKEKKNKKIHELLGSSQFKDALNERSGLEITPETALDEINLQINVLRLQRLMSLSSNIDRLMAMEDPTKEDLDQLMSGQISGEGWKRFLDMLKEWQGHDTWHYLLWHGPSAGAFLLDLEIIKILLHFRVKVIISVKQAFYYHDITMADIIDDPYLADHLREADIIARKDISKNELIEKLKSDKTVFVISDGTQEKFNPLLTSVTFARAFKEADAVVVRSPEDAYCIERSHFRFTRDMIFRATTGRENRLVLKVKPHHPKVIRFSEKDLRAKAESLIYHLQIEKSRGKTIMFYSAIVGSIPNQLETAKKILKVFVSYLRQKQEGVVVINPAEHFEPGMDADDIMYMWEIVQRSGLIDIWRFQTYEDIEKAFELLGEKVPPEWVGKDATYSTGCTKEMQIAREVQKEHPEMQIIGPSWEKFLRRKEYGVGKLFDRALGDVS